MNRQCYDKIFYATIEDKTIYPTAPQALMCLIVCQSLSDLYRDIQLFRFNAQRGYVFIMTGDEIQIIVFRDGTWRFINETEF
ncbi:hypothetical protein [Kamptonema sp. UHCC 0994]|uniref:DUF6888 family protein n=1 Tax=Kamptonema sp. UHCC 0994 TaxID=3031329 RepID=UPI0023B92BDF|nr:hypothetical protein [Kamptonema sp. UHCC 0994]MDF0554158.1 hypothetical protein [Kamptonema sp. UHCC 0994]